MLSKQWAPVYFQLAWWMQTITNILPSSSFFPPLPPHISFARPSFHLNTVFLGGTHMATARFDMSVAMEEHFNNCGCSCTILLINWMFNVLNLFEDWAWLCFVLPRDVFWISRFLGHWNDLQGFVLFPYINWQFDIQYTVVSNVHSLYMWWISCTSNFLWQCLMVMMFRPSTSKMK